MVFYVSCIFHLNFFDIKLKQVYNSNGYHKPVFAKEIKYFSLMHSYHLKELKQGHDGKTPQLGPGHHNTELK